MSKWEDIVKEKLEGYESKLPEGSLAEFRALRAGAGSARTKRRSPAVWAAAAAIAAGLAAVLLLKKPDESQGDIQIIGQAPAPVSGVPATTGTDFTSTTALSPSTRLIEQATKSREIRPALPVVTEDIQPEEPEETDAPGQTEEPDPNILEAVDVPTPAVIPENHPVRENRFKAAHVVGGLAGAGTLGLLASTKGLGFLSLFAATEGLLPSPPIEDDVVRHSSHHFPLRTGLSARIPLTDRLSVTTGLEYSLYSSTFTYSISGDKKQTAHYLGVPLRVDGTIVSGKRFDLYAGGGLLGDVCVGASLDGSSIRKDGPSLSVVGAGGIQLNLTEHLGLYLEPGVQYTLPLGERVLQTYRSEHPLMLSVSGGLRFTFGKQNK